VGFCEHGNEPSGSLKEGNFSTGRSSFKFSSKTAAWS